VSAEDTIRRLKSVVSDNLAAYLAAEDARQNDGLTTPVPASTAYYLHRLPAVEPQILPAVALYHDGADFEPMITSTDDDLHRVVIVYAVAEQDRAKLDAYAMRGGYAVRRLLRDPARWPALSVTGTPTGFSGIIQLALTDQRYVFDDVDGGGALVKGTALTLRCRERVSY